MDTAPPGKYPDLHWGKRCCGDLSGLSLRIRKHRAWGGSESTYGGIYLWRRGGITVRRRFRCQYPQKSTLGLLRIASATTRFDLAAHSARRFIAANGPADSPQARKAISASRCPVGPRRASGARRARINSGIDVSRAAQTRARQG
jgi:hypothetical protein